jgi:altronate dehydratase small subunit
MKKAIMMEAVDNVATVLNTVEAGDEVEILSSRQETMRRVRAQDSVPRGHKIAISDIKKGAEVKKYGATIGLALKDIASGEYVHIHNVKSKRLPLTEHMLGYGHRK